MYNYTKLFYMKLRWIKLMFKSQLLWVIIDLWLSSCWSEHFLTLIQAGCGCLPSLISGIILDVLTTIPLIDIRLSISKNREFKENP